ncbi:serine hydrolase [Luteimonas aestuarii]|uniref:Serine hydrolase n=1 Tax=Luteimonas aestuarii TaxID=453837 RepID=A0A4R5TMF3_9GAMM|nr:serine hydrolase domain-containing protein [Luteimonas aestuarii]TDK23833.1 serine hydrolase [Luteimonas aestuarii]
MRRLLVLVLLPMLLCGVARAASPAAAEVAEFSRQAMARHCVPTGPGLAVLVARGDELLFRGACGLADVASGAPLTPDHVFRVASVTKQFTAAGVLKLVDEGRLSLDDPLSKYLPAFPDAGGITVGMLLNHTAGVRNAAIMPAADAGTQGMVDAIGNAGVDFPPGQGYRYSNAGYVLAGAVIERVTGMAWDAYLHQAFFAPLGMTRTRGGHDVGVGDRTGEVTGHVIQQGAWSHARQMDMRLPHAAGALVSTLDDLWAWNRALHAGTVLSAQSHGAMATPRGKAADGNYGYGIAVGTLRGSRVFRHNGGISGASAYLAYLPEHDLTVAVLSNADALQPEVVRNGYLANLLAAHAIGKPYPSRDAIHVDPESLRQYEGVYRTDAATARVLRVVEGRLTSQRIPGGQPVALEPVARDAFALEAAFSRMVFERDAAGAVVAMQFLSDDEAQPERIERSDEPLPSVRQEVRVPVEALQRIAGEYVYRSMTLVVSVDDGTPRVRFNNQQQPIELVPQSPSLFSLKVVDATLEFTPDGDIARKAILRMGPAVNEYVRREQ